MAGIIIEPRARILHGHDWVFPTKLLSFRAKRSGVEESLEKAIRDASTSLGMTLQSGRMIGR